MERLHKFLARAGVDSRRACEDLMLAGRVSVNGRVQRELGTQIDPDKDDIRVDGEQITPPTELHYVLLNKPSSVMTTLSDPEGRQTVADLVKAHNRLFPVGRLDYDSEGLLLMTDDGDLTFRLTHPSFEVEKEYQALLNQAPSVEQLREWRNGVELDDGKTAPAWIEMLNETPDGTWVRVVIHEGRNRQIRRVAEALGLEVRRLIRLREGPLTLGELQPGQWRALTPTEIDRLRMHGKQSKAWTPVRPQENAEGGKQRRQVRRIDRSGQLVERRADVEPRLQRAPHFTSQENTMSFEDFSIEEERSNPDRPSRRPEPRREGGFSDRGPRREGGSPSDRGPRREGGFSDRGPRREGGFSDRGPRREGGDADRGPRREGGFSDRGPRREGGDFADRGPRREGGFSDRGPRREGGDADRGPRREGGFSDRGPRREGGDFADRGPRREGGFSDRGPRREGGDFADRGPRREGGGFGERGPRREGGDFGDRGPRREGGGFGERGPRRESGGGFGERGPRREGGDFGDRGPRREGGGFGERGPRREGGGFSERGPRREGGGGFGERGPRREGGGGGFGERGPRREGGGGFGERGPRREGGGGGFGERGPRREGGGGFGERGPRREGGGGGFGERGPRREGGGGFGERGPRREGGGGFTNRPPRRDASGFDRTNRREEFFDDRPRGERGLALDRAHRGDDRPKNTFGGGRRSNNQGSFDRRGFDNRGRDDRRGFDNRGRDDRRGFDDRSAPRRDQAPRDRIADRGPIVARNNPAPTPAPTPAPSADQSGQPARRMRVVRRLKKAGGDEQA